MSIARLGAVARPTPKAPEAADPTLGLLSAFGENPVGAREYVTEVRAAIAENERVRSEAEAKIAEASKVIDAADNREQEARETLRNVEQECARLRAVVAASEADLATDRAQHDEGVRVDTETLVKREAAVAEREAASRATEDRLAGIAADLVVTGAKLSAREEAVAEREAAMDAREARLKAALG